MHAFTTSLRLAKDGLETGVHSVASAVEHIAPGARDPGEPRETGAPNDAGAASPPAQATQAPQAAQATQAAAPASLLSTLASGTSALLSPPAVAAAAASSLAGTARAAGTGLSIAAAAARSGVDAGTNVVSRTAGTAALAGTALGAVVAAAADASGAVFEPVGAGLKTLDALAALERLEHGARAVNGLSFAAVDKVRELTSRALAVSGKIPTFFDPDADAVVRVPDTVRGLVLLGLDDKVAAYAAYALHTVFSYSTGASWVPALDKSLPIRVDNMSRTRWGSNWGSFERLEWVNDVELDKFFTQKMSDKSLADYWKQGRQGFGILLLIFEWGTTWPFYMPPLSVPVHQIPFADDIGSVVRKAILPTIISNYKQARALNPPSPEAPKPSEDPVNMPGEYTG